MLDERVGGLADQDLVSVRRLREPFRENHRLARHERVPFRGIPGHDLSGIDPDPDLEADVERPLELLVQTCEPRKHLLGGPDAAEGVVLVCDGHPEHRHHLVPDELLDGAAMPLDDLSHPLEETGLNPPVVLRVTFGEPGRVDEVAKQNRDGLSLLVARRDFGEARAAEGTERRRVLAFAAAVRTRRHAATVDRQLCDSNEPGGVRAWHGARRCCSSGHATERSAARPSSRRRSATQFARPTPRACDAL